MPDAAMQAAVPSGVVALEASTDPEAQANFRALLQALEVLPLLWAKTETGNLALFRVTNAAVEAKLRRHLPTGVSVHGAGAQVTLPASGQWQPEAHTPRSADALPEIGAADVARLSPADPVVARTPLSPYSLRGQSEAFRQMAIEARPLLGEVCLRGQVAVWYAAPGTGKTLIALNLMIDAVREGRIAGENCYYINADDNGQGFALKLQLLDDIRANTLAPGFKGFRAADLIPLLHAMADKQQARGVLVLIDTVKKFTSLMDKKESAAFAQACRAVAMRGGTVLGLAHTTKSPNADESPRYAGTTDLVDDADAAYTINPLQTLDDTKEAVVEFRCFKSRGDCAERAAYAFAAERGINYEERLASVRPIDAAQIDGFRRIGQERSDTELIDAVAACIGEGFDTKMVLAKEVASRTGVSARAAARVIDRYTGTDPSIHRWRFERRAHGAQKYEMLPPPPG